MMISRLSAMTLAVTALLAAAPSRASPRPTVEAPAGRALGVDEGVVHAFLGLPYAAPPVGARRWAPPEPLGRWPGVRDASAFGPACFQPPSHNASMYAARRPSGPRRRKRARKAGCRSRCSTTGPASCARARRARTGLRTGPPMGGTGPSWRSGTRRSRRRT